MEGKTKFCKHCGEKIQEEAIICIKCGRQVEEFKKNEGERVVINNTNINTNHLSSVSKQRNKWISLALCVFTIFGHKFYEGKIGMGFLYLFTAGLFGVGWVIDIIVLIFKPNPYYV